MIVVPGFSHGQRKLTRPGIPSVSCKASGLVTEVNWRNWRDLDFRPYLDVVSEAFGPNRIMFGSEWLVCLLAAKYENVRTLMSNYVRELPTEQQSPIFGLNAISFYGLKTPRHEPATVR